MAELKTKVNDASVNDFLNSVGNDKKRDLSYKVLKLMKEVTKEDPKMWGTSIVGFGKYKYQYKSGREDEWMLTGFSPRKQSVTLYIMSGFSKYEDLLKDLGTFKTGKSCLYIKKEEDIDFKVLKELIKQSVRYLKSI